MHHGILAKRIKTVHTYVPVRTVEVYIPWLKSQYSLWCGHFIFEDVFVGFTALVRAAALRSIAKEHDEQEERRTTREQQDINKSQKPTDEYHHVVHVPVPAIGIESNEHNDNDNDNDNDP